MCDSTIAASGSVSLVNQMRYGSTPAPQALVVPAARVSVRNTNQVDEPVASIELSILFINQRVVGCKMRAFQANTTIIDYIYEERNGFKI